ncbi:hypothetical protein E6C76_11600 [Pseudothauera nasutitermitis]|uniref:DUF6129 domain-containing protein n=1 Tax=Pseudothauera nasutitermitis TaxID=2565930 RepID=A0A4S4B1A6_9RHOO|nr:DUF6129 family protein [Pseudothauera nasutitermitis]THF64688.1 hypothetical protein E6C76_11600 [Pseudothauera nasutitermitis]
MIGAEVLSGARSVLERHGHGEAALAALRGQWPGLRFVGCSEDDVPPRLKPADTGGGWALYYIAGGGHCLALTTDPGAAIGLVVAECLPDD